MNVVSLDTCTVELSLFWETVVYPRYLCICGVPEDAFFSADMKGREGNYGTRLERPDTAHSTSPEVLCGPVADKS